MNPIPINLAIEDRLSESVLRRLLDHVNRGYCVGTAYGKSGSGYLRKTISGWNNGAKGIPFAVLTDLDDFLCPGQLIESWLGNTKHHNLLLRVAVREVESWLLADGRNLSSYLSISPRLMPDDPDSLADAKRTLVSLAARSRSPDIRSRLVPKRGSTATQGRDHNSLSIFVDSAWDVEAARTKSPSLQRALVKLEIFQPTWST
jgi:hypothetical protein